VAQVLASAAVTVVLVTASGSVIRERCPALTVEICAPALLDMACCWAGGITWSAVPMSDQDGIVFHASGPEGSKNWFKVAGRCTAARMAVWVVGLTPLAKHREKPG
jgi:hypothetical protein